MDDLVKLAEKRIRHITDVRSCTNLDVLRRFNCIHNLNGKKDIFTAASTVVSEIEADVKKLKLFPKQSYYLRNKIMKLFQDFRKVKKSFKPRSLVQRPHVQRFYKHLSDLFPCTQEFERVVKKINERTNTKMEEEEIYVTSHDESKDPNWSLLDATSQVSKFVFISPTVCRLLDSLGISSNSMARILLEIKHLNNVECSISSSSVLRNRSNERKELMKRLHQFDFPNFLVLHWDGKRMENNNHEMVERLVISVSASNGLKKLISCNFIEDSTGKTIANELKKQCDQLQITNKIVGLSYDTTAANSGIKAGAAVLFEKSLKLKENVKHLNRRPCRLHQKELCVANPFKVVVMKTVGAGIPVFAQFRKWFNLNRDLKITPAYYSQTAKPILEKNMQSLVEFYTEQTKINHRRADHREVAELALVHLNANPNYKLKTCGADHHARWLSKVIYIFKIMLYKESFKISETLMEQFEAMLLYFITVYLKYWFTCESTVYAAKNDLDFLIELDEFSQTKGKYFDLIASSAKSTQLRHMDYLSKENSIISIFDDRIALEEKEKLRIKLLGSNSQDQYTKLLTIDPNVSFSSSDLDEDNNRKYPLCTKDENIDDFGKLLNETDAILYEKDFSEVVDKETITCNAGDESAQSTYFDPVVSKTPFDFITLESLKTLVDYGINVSFMLFNANEWPTHKSYLNAMKTANNIQSTSIYTEQLVGRISLLNKSCLLKNKDNLNSLAISAVDRSGMN